MLALRSTATHTKEADTAKRPDRRVFGGGEGSGGGQGRQTVSRQCFAGWCTAAIILSPPSLSLSLCRQRCCIDQLETVPTLSTPQSCSWLQFLQSNPKRRQPRHIILVILNRQSRAERQNTFDWLHILPVRVTISQYKSYSASGRCYMSNYLTTDGPKKIFSTSGGPL